MKTFQSSTLIPTLLLLGAVTTLAADRPARGAKAAPAAAPLALDSPVIDLPPPPLPPVVAVVEGVEIKGAELEQAFNGFLASRHIPANELPDAERSRGYHMVLDEMVKEKLIENRAATTKVSDEEVQATFKQFSASLGTEADVKKQIEASGQTVEKVYENIRSSLKQDHWLEAAINKSGGVTDAEAKDFYTKNAEKFVAPAEVRASHILISVPPEATPEVVAAKQKAAGEIAARVKKGEDFAKLAKELSEDPSAKENSGDLNFFKKEQMVPEFSTAAFSMKTGEISEPIRSQFGFHIIKVTDHHDSSTVPLETVKPKLLTFLKGQKAEALKQEIRATADVKINLPPEAKAEPDAPAAPVSAGGAPPAPAK